MLRLERYRSWSMQYEMKFLSLIKECSSINKDATRNLLFERWALMRALNRRVARQDDREWEWPERNGDDSDYDSCLDYICSQEEIMEINTLTKYPKTWWDGASQIHGVPRNSARICRQALRTRAFLSTRRVVIKHGCLAWESRQDFEQRTAAASLVGNGKC